MRGLAESLCHELCSLATLVDSVLVDSELVESVLVESALHGLADLRAVMTNLSGHHATTQLTESSITSPA